MEPLECLRTQHTYHINKKKDQHYTSNAWGVWKNCLYLWCFKKYQTVLNPTTFTRAWQVPHTSQEPLIKDKHRLQTQQTCKLNITPTPSLRLITSYLPTIQVSQKQTSEVKEEFKGETASDYEEALKKTAYSTHYPHQRHNQTLWRQRKRTKSHSWRLPSFLFHSILKSFI